jgi:hypothetical protein
VSEKTSQSERRVWRDRYRQMLDGETVGGNIFALIDGLGRLLEDYYAQAKRISELEDSETVKAALCDNTEIQSLKERAEKAEAKVKKLEEQLRWRKTSEEPPPRAVRVWGYAPAEGGSGAWAVLDDVESYWSSPAPLETWWTYWRPLGPLPEAGDKQ